MDVTARVAQFVAETRYDKLPAEAVATAKEALLDCLGVTLAGSKEESGKICGEIARQERAREESTVLGQGFKSSALQAAFANGTAAHALDFDHSFTLGGQPTAPIIPAVFSLGESLRASGRQLLEAYVAGFEVTGKLVRSVRGSNEEGWHAPGIFGVFGASAACAKLLSLDASQVQMALGITASMASGVVANFGTMTKPLHVGLAARNGVLAAKLAQRGFTANAQAIEGEVGFYESFYRGMPGEVRVLEELGNSYELVTSGIKIKPYPCGGLTHPAIDAALELRAQHGITPEMVESVTVDVQGHTYNRIIFRVPETGLQGKFCMPYLLARAIADAKVSLDAFTDAAVRDQNILRLAKKVEMRLDENLKSSDASSRPARVTVRLKNGQSHSCYVEHAKGSREVPLTADNLKAKFMECACQAIDQSSAERAMEYIERIETLDSIASLCELLRG
jgi:2-methylcitrate dehydratase PrpD